MSERFMREDFAAVEAFVTGASNPSICCVEGSRVRTLVTPATAPDLTVNDQASGFSTRDSFASFDLVSSSWRTSQRCLLEEWDASLETWPASGSMRSGRAFTRAKWVKHTHDRDCSLWPTPTASMDGRGFGIPLHERSGRYKRSTVLRVQELVRSHGWRIHPHFTETLMGFPIGWSAIAPSATASTPTSLNGSAGA